MAEFFNGRILAQEKLKLLSKDITKLSGRGIKPKLVSIIVGNDPASQLYVNLKKRTGENIGVAVEIKSFDSGVGKKKIIESIEKLNKDKTIHGIMVQLPLPDNFSREDRGKIIDSIDKDKDVDGLRVNSSFITPTVKAVLEAFTAGIKQLSFFSNVKVFVVGASGFEGGKIYRVLNDMGYKITGGDSKTKNLRSKTLSADILISATGEKGLIKDDMVKKGSLLIDVGSPKGDIDNSAYEKAGYVSPVPGGVGPVTISCLFENLVEAASN